MRLLYINFKIEYINPTIQVVDEMLHGCGELLYYGPGYTRSDELAHGINNFVSKNGPFDFIILNEQMVWNCFWFDYVNRAASDVEKDLSARYRHYAYRYFKGYHDLAAMIPDVYRYILENSVKKLFIFLASDYYNWAEHQFSILRELTERGDTFILGWGKQFVRPVNELPRLAMEDFARNANDNWFSFVNQYDSKIISMVHVLSPMEISVCKSVSQRKYSIFVPGANYYARKLARKVLSLSKIRRPFDTGSFAYAFFDKIGIHPFSNRMFIRYYRWQFRYFLKNSKSVFTCGSGLQWAIRKYFEVPACGAVLLCIPCEGFDELGFVHMKNCICAEPDELPDYAVFLERHSSTADLIARAGQELIREKHTVPYRSKKNTGVS